MVTHTLCTESLKCIVSSRLTRATKRAPVLKGVKVCVCVCVGYDSMLIIAEFDLRQVDLKFKTGLQHTEECSNQK